MHFGKTLEQSGDLIWTYSFAEMIVAPKIDNWIWWLGANSPIWSKLVNLNWISEKNQKSIFLIYESFWFDIKSFWFDIKSFWFVETPPRWWCRSTWQPVGIGQELLVDSSMHPVTGTLGWLTALPLRVGSNLEPHLGAWNVSVGISAGVVVDDVIIGSTEGCGVGIQASSVFVFNVLDESTILLLVAVD